MFLTLVIVIIALTFVVAGIVKLGRGFFDEIQFRHETRDRRTDYAGYPWVMIMEDGSAREVTNDERRVLQMRRVTIPRDEGPYIKLSYEARDGWGRRSGFLERRKLPQNISVLPPDEDHARQYAECMEIGVEKILEAHRLAGDELTENEDGSISVTPSPQSFEKMRGILFPEMNETEPAEQDGADRSATDPEQQPQ